MTSASLQPIIIRELGLKDYLPVWQQMQQFTDTRTSDTTDEIWLLEHPPVYTQGQAGKSEHLLCPGDIPVVQSDRGGQVTYHGPGQLVAYLLMDVRRRGYSIRQLVSLIEQSIIQTARQFGITAQARCDAPGVYINDAKLCSVGLRIRRGCSYHGLALNVAMDLTPFQRINPCGYAKLTMTELRAYVPNITMYAASQALQQQLQVIFTI